MKIKIDKTITLLILFALFALVSLILDFDPGITIGKNFVIFLKNMGLLLPPVFILIGLFEVWVKKESIEKYLGKQSGISSFLFVILLASTMVGGIVVALPVAASLFNKGAKPSVVYTFIFASAICRIPMTFFEASYLGFKFTIIRLIVSLPLIVLASVIIGKVWGKNQQLQQ